MISKKKASVLLKALGRLFHRFEIYQIAAQCVDSEGNVLAIKINKDQGSLSKVGHVEKAEAPIIIQPGSSTIQ